VHLILEILFIQPLFPGEGGTSKDELKRNPLRTRSLGDIVEVADCIGPGNPLWRVFHQVRVSTIWHDNSDLRISLPVNQHFCFFDSFG
jgi:hypothetical protein